MTESTQERVASFVDEHNLDKPLPEQLVELANKVGELATAYLEASDYGKRDFLPTDNWLDDITTVYLALLCVANQTHVDLEHALEVRLKHDDSKLD